MSNDKKAQQAQDMADYKKALRTLHAYHCESGDDAKFLRLNAAVIRAEKKVAWWKRGWL